MNVLEYYIEKNKDQSWREAFQSSGANMPGKVYFFFSVNHRKLLTFIDNFKKFYEYNGLPRAKWAVSEITGQEKAKQFTVRLRQSKLFKIVDKINDVYALTAKGFAFKDLVESDFNEEEKWALTYLFVLTSYFDLTPNYMSIRSQELLDTFVSAGLDLRNIYFEIENILLKNISDRVDLFKTDVFWYFSFNKDTDFLYLYNIATSQEKKDLYDYVIRNYESGHFNDCISYKYKASGQYTPSTFLDDLKIFYFTNHLKSVLFSSKTDFYSYFVDLYSGIFNSTRREKIVNFINEHMDIMEIIYDEFMNKFEDEMDGDYVYTPRNTADIDINEKVDDTTTVNKEKIQGISDVLKRMTKERCRYKCELEVLNNCKYFTAKENNKNYLEIHHLVPRSFSNEFENSIELIDNYVALCPYCHRMLHLAVDRERIQALTFLYNQRHDNLLEKGIAVDLDTFKKFYGLDDNN